MQGKIRAIISNPGDGAQVIYEGKIRKITEYDEGNDNFDSVCILNGSSESVDESQLYKLVVEYTPHKEYRHISVKSHSIPLKYSQWQAAIDNGEVDSDKTVQFEMIQNLISGSEYSAGQSDINRGKKVYAKIIPSKKEDNFLEKFDAFINERIELASSLQSGNAYEIVKRFVHQHYKK